MKNNILTGREKLGLSVDALGIPVKLCSITYTRLINNFQFFFEQLGEKMTDRHKKSPSSQHVYS